MKMIGWSGSLVGWVDNPHGQAAVFAANFTLAQNETHWTSLQRL